MKRILPDPHIVFAVVVAAGAAGCIVVTAMTAVAGPPPVPANTCRELSEFIELVADLRDAEINGEKYIALLRRTHELEGVGLEARMTMEREVRHVFATPATPAAVRADFYNRCMVDGLATPPVIRKPR